MKKVLYIITLLLTIAIVLGYKELYNYQNLTTQLLKENNKLQNDIKEHKNQQKNFNQNNTELNKKIEKLQSKITNLENNITTIEYKNKILNEKNIKCKKDLELNKTKIKEVIVVPEINYSIQTKENNIKDLNFTAPKSVDEFKPKKIEDSESIVPTVDVDMENKNVNGFHINYTNKF